MEDIKTKLGKIQYESIDNMEKEELTAALGIEPDPSLSLKKLRAKVKSIHRQFFPDADDLEDGDIEHPGEEIDHTAAQVTENSAVIDRDDERDPVVVMEGDAEEPAKADRPNTNIDDLPPSVALLLEQLTARLEAVEQHNAVLQSQVESAKALDKSAKQERAFERCRVSNHYRDVMKEHKHFEQTGEKKIFIVRRNPKSELTAFTTGKLLPCAPNGGMYWLKNRFWQASPKTGEIRKVTHFSRFLYCDYTMEGNKQRRVNPNYMLCDVTGKEVKPFANALPLENLAKGVPYKPKKARKQTVEDLLKELGAA